MKGPKLGFELGSPEAQHLKAMSIRGYNEKYYFINYTRHICSVIIMKKKDRL